jgi:hypothetical protein
MAWSISSPPPIFEGEDELQLKLQFAKAIAGHPERIQTAGYEIFPGEENYGRAMQCRAWANDPIVLREIERILEAPETNSKDELKQQIEDELLRIGRDSSVAVDMRLKSYEQVRDMNGWKTVGGNVQLNDNRVINVLRVPTRDVTPEDDADFDRRFKDNQMKLVTDARSNRPAAAG